MTQPLLTAPQVAVRLNVSEQTVRRWAASGRLPAARLPGGRLRFAPADVDKLLEPAAADPR
jgi:excisionase family DNA binding protein